MLVILILAIIALLQRKTIKVQDEEIESQLKDIIKKNSFLDFAALIYLFGFVIQLLCYLIHQI